MTTHTFWLAWAVASVAGVVIIVKALNIVLEWLDERWPQ